MAHVARRDRIAALALAALLVAGSAGAQNAAQPAVRGSAQGQVVEDPIPVAPDAPPGSSAEVAIGAGVGVLAGLFVLILVFSSGG